MSEQASRTRARWSFAAAIVTLAAVWLAMLLGGAGAFDQRIYEAFFAGHRPVLLAIARFFTFFGEPTLLIGAAAVVALLLWRARLARTGLVLLAVTLTGRILSEVQKYWIARARPDLEPHLVIVKTSSFPSGHATSSMIFYLTVALVLADHSRWRFTGVVAAIMLSLLIGTSRVMLGVHWPSDVVGGWAFGLLWVLLTLGPAERLLHINSETA
jgi:membrane-associated phospholipid phosphatase